MPDYPLMFTFRDAVSGNGFLAGITVFGRALMTKEDDEKWWMYGVRPGAVAGRGDTPQEASHHFREQYRLLLYDYAEEARDFEEFKSKVEQFYAQPSEENETSWVSAFEAIRAGAVAIEEPFAALPRVAPETRPTGISIQPMHQMKRYTSTDNVVDSYEFAAAAA
jgi:predicted RNase H-like HicB family nuclease